jgi:hypothetical protein
MPGSQKGRSCSESGRYHRFSSHLPCWPWYRLASTASCLSPQHNGPISSAHAWPLGRSACTYYASFFSYHGRCQQLHHGWPLAFICSGQGLRPVGRDQLLRCGHAVARHSPADRGHSQRMPLSCALRLPHRSHGRIADRLGRPPERRQLTAPKCLDRRRAVIE